MVSAGTITIGGRDVTSAPASERDVSMVFQSYALFPHMNVLENVAYGPSVSGDKAAKDKAHEKLRMVGLDAYGNRMPSELSGGQQQRVAVARALVLEPQVLLFDEPLSNLDAKLRRRVREEIRELQQSLGLTVAYVTHDQQEALAVSDQIIVMSNARIAQIGAPRELYEAPRDRFVADFIGDANLVEAELGAHRGARAPVAPWRPRPRARPSRCRARQGEGRDPSRIDRAQAGEFFGAARNYSQIRVSWNAYGIHGGIADRLAVRGRPRGVTADAGGHRGVDHAGESRRRPGPRLAVHFDPALPINARRDEIRAAIDAHPIVIVCGETGSGKTTQLPKILLERGLERGAAPRIGHTQPRRIAARSVAARIAEELGSELGDRVGYKVRFHEQVGKRTAIKLMTDGILLAETQSDRELRQYDSLIIDEAHERSLNIDFLLGYLKQLSRSRPELKIIITSATIDAERFSRHFDGAPVIEVSGRLYPVDVRYRPVGGDAEDTTRDEEEQALADAVDELCRQGPGDILVFLPGEREIRDAADTLRRKGPKGLELLPLYSRLSAADQDRVFKPGKERRVVLATNVAETSLTVPRIRYVVDTGDARVKRYSYRNKVEMLRVEPISQAAAQQRAGRCGRVADGVCIRLYSEEEFAKRPAFTDPELLRSSLASVILRAKSLGLGEVEAFPFVDPPSPRAIADGYELLTELGAVDEKRDLTPIGEELARLPLDPRVARMLVAARAERCLAQVRIIAAALSVQDPRERPMERAAAADERHARFADEQSDFLSLLKLWKLQDEQGLRRLCRENFLSYARMREWRDVHEQLKQTLEWEESSVKPEKADGYRAIHRALLAGLLGNVGLRDEDGSYTGARGIKFWVHPGSWTKKPGKWIVAAELVETTRLFARTVATVEPRWLEEIGGHLLKRSRGDPHWEKSQGQVVALERGALYGLPVYTNRRVPFGPFDPDLARDVFIRAALVEGDFETRAPFFSHNRRLLADIERLEHKSRRPDILVDDELIHAFYDERIPREIHTAGDFERWRRQAEAAKPRLLYLAREDLMRHEAAGITTDNFPPTLALGPNRYQLEYHFEPGSARDGVTLNVPLALLNQVPTGAHRVAGAGVAEGEGQGAGQVDAAAPAPQARRRSTTSPRPSAPRYRPPTCRWPKRCAATCASTSTWTCRWTRSARIPRRRTCT